MNIHELENEVIDVIPFYGFELPIPMGLVTFSRMNGNNCGIVPFADRKQIIRIKKVHLESIAVSDHSFFGF